MSSKTPPSSSDISANRIAEPLVETQLRARREEYALGFTRYATWFCTALSLLLLGAWVLAPAYPQLLVFAVFILLLALGTAFYPVFQRRNRASAGFSIVCSLALIVISISPLLLPGLLPVIGITDLVAVMIMTIVLGKRASRWLVGAFIVAYLVDVVVVAVLGWRPFPPLERSTELWLTGAINLGSILVQILVVRLTVLGLEQQFQRAQRLNLALETQMQTLNETQATLKHERNLLRLLIDTVPANVYIKDMQSRFVDANIATALQMGMMNPSDLIGKTDFDFFSAEFAEKYFADEQSILRSGVPLHNLEESNVDERSKQRSWFLTTKVPILDEQGVVTGLVGVGLDITQQARAQEQIEQERDVLRTLIDHLPDYIFVKDADGRFVNSNAAHNQSAQVKDTAALRGKSAVDVFPPDLAAQFDADDQQVMLSGQALVNIERTTIDAQGHERLVLTTKVPLRDVTGKVIGLVGISRDITERKQTEAQAFALAAEQQRGNLLRKFISDVSHDFRTPLSIIGSSAYLVSKTTDSTKLSRYSKQIEAQVSRLTLLMDSFVELVALEQQASTFQFRPTDLDALLITIIERSQPEAQAKRQRLEYRRETDSTSVLGDPAALTKAIHNVVANAIHYTPDEGSITLRLCRDGDVVVVEVADTGIGIQVEDLMHIFENLNRVDSARSAESGGAGLGLPIAKKLIELMKGHIDVESTFGTGSVFKIYLPSYA